MAKAPTLDDLRRYAVARTLFKPTTLGRAIDKLGFVQADPIRAPARAQDLILRHRVAGYRAGDLERRYARLKIEEDAFVNYGFLPRRHLALMHPRSPTQAWTAATTKKAADVLDFIRARGPTHPRDVEAHFAHGRRINAWGGSGLATTHLLDGMHYRGLLRIQRRDSGTRIYAAVEHPPADADAAARAARAAALLELVVRKYAPLPASSLVYLARLLRYGAPHLQAETRTALAALRERLASVQHRRDDVVLAGRREPALGAARAATSASACSRRSTRSSGTGAASSCSGTGPIASRRTRRRRSASSATTRCRCSGATRSSAGPTPPCAGAAWSSRPASRTARRRATSSATSSRPSASGWRLSRSVAAGRRARTEPPTTGGHKPGLASRDALRRASRAAAPRRRAGAPAGRGTRLDSRRRRPEPAMRRR